MDFGYVNVYVKILEILPRRGFNYNPGKVFVL